MSDSGQIQTVGQRFLTAFADCDFASVHACFHPKAGSRALIPPGMCEAAEAVGATSHFREWFGGADGFEVLNSEVSTVVDRLRIAYRLRVHDGDGWQLFEQQAYCDVRDGTIAPMDLLCSGSRLDPHVVPGNSYS